MGTQPYLTDEQVARIRGAAVPQPGRWSVAGRRAGHTQPAREAEADAILAVNKAIKKVAKAGQLCPVFDAKCREKDRPRRLRERLAYAHGLLRNGLGWFWGMKWMLLALGTMAWLFVKAAPFMWLMVKGFAFLIPLWILTTLFGGFNRNRPYRGHYWYYLRRW